MTRFCTRHRLPLQIELSCFYYAAQPGFTGSDHSFGKRRRRRCADHAVAPLTTRGDDLSFGKSYFHHLFALGALTLAAELSSLPGPGILTVSLPETRTTPGVLVLMASVTFPVWVMVMVEVLTFQGLCNHACRAARRGSVMPKRWGWGFES